MLKRLDRKEMEEIYGTRMREDFPAAELKPWKRIAEMMDTGVYFAYGMYEEERLLAYAFFVKAAGGQLLLDYYAVSEQTRGAGVGSRGLCLLKEEIQKQGYGAIVIEVENPDFAKTEEERQKQERRIRFYEKNGARMTGLRSCLFGVEYKIMYLPAQKEEKRLRKKVDEIYHTMFPEKYFEKEVFLYE